MLEIGKLEFDRSNESTKNAFLVGGLVKDTVINTTTTRMNPLTTGGHPRFRELLEEIAKLHANKDHDYSKDGPLANFYVAKDIGVQPYIGCIIRMLDKVERIKSLIKKGNNRVKSESLTDSLMDLSVYSLLTIILLEEANNDSSTKETTC